MNRTAEHLTWIETKDARYYGYIQAIEVNGSIAYVASIWARGFCDESSVNTRISTFYKYSIGDARRALIKNINMYNPAIW